MNIKSSLKYQLFEFKRPIIIFYIVIIAVIFLFFIMNIAYKSSDISFNGMDVASIIFIFIAGLNSFKSIFYLFSANGISRKTLFTSFIISTAPICGLMALIDTIIGFMLSLFINYNTMFFQVYNSRYGHENNINLFSGKLQFLGESFLWSFFTYAMFIIIGFLITVIYYRMNKITKILVSVGVPIFFTSILPTIDGILFKGAIIRSIINLFSFIFGDSNPYISILFSIMIFIILTVISFLFIRKAPIKD
ncbi:MAG: hypothetical protein K0S55_424 [Clostridia bacterium]|nr:hypothetical protein [Clostridia bacterium]